MRQAKTILTLFVSLWLLAACSSTPEEVRTTPGATPGSVAIASAHPMATQAGLDVLAAGGNAVDAAIAVAASLGVVEPYAAGIGGGGFWLIYNAAEDKYRFIDARETAPKAAHRDYYLKDGKPDRDRSINGPSAAAIPGQPAAFAYLSQRYGLLPLAQLLQPAIEQARNGFAVDKRYQKLANFRLHYMQRYPATAKIFLHNNHIPPIGHRIVQPELATTLELLAEQGKAGFYQGELAQTLVNAVQENGGDWTLEDLASYQVVEREPIFFEYGEHTIVSAPPPSSGGIALAQMLRMLDAYQQQTGTDWRQLDKVAQAHLLTEVMRRAYRDRAEFLGDPDFYQVPVEKLLSDQRAADYATSIDAHKASVSLEMQGPANLHEGRHTTHLSVLDKYGNRVSATLSINLPFGSAFTVAGVVLNNEMDDFSLAPGVPNSYGLVGAEANAIEGGKRPLSSMTPTMIESCDQIAILGAPGGSRIITQVLLGTLGHIQGQSVHEWVSQPRFHHQYLPDRIQMEPTTFTRAEQTALRAMGHEVRSVGRQYGNMQAIVWDVHNSKVSAASDPRGVGEAKVLTVPQLNAQQ
ncbi:gamma-glutamyltranspeptidase [Bacterioplanes sanyensis]|uniref:gamma-glutamyltransferase n=1 Tax=Bacterioplanes sanyensis TaxID=1249553 RepID=UPI00167B12C0|nr:gamma-glutamyltransferase [Bacterioplanes sanyensis]GGY57147.1 gamma-glutamyltranspeptidase [Bacterioplanes sanyensis]